jgi:hypothetical protein
LSWEQLMGVGLFGATAKNSPTPSAPLRPASP